MTVADDVLRLLRGHPAGLSDKEIAERLGKGHTHINICCRQLETQGLLTRVKWDTAIVNTLSGRAPARPAPPVAAQSIAPDHAWDWEGNVQATLCRWLAAQGWALRQVADTASKERGTDVVADRAGERIHIEVKGFPSTTYSDPRRAGELKPTQPTLQAAHWYAGALLKALQLRQSHPDESVAMAFPDRPRYRSLLESTASTLTTMRVTVFLVAEDGSVTAWAPE